MPPTRLIPLYISRFPAGCLTSRVSCWSPVVRWAKSLARVWTNSVCGHPQQGETFEQAVTRRCRFELGVEIADIAPVHPAFRYRAVAPNGIVENEVCPVYAARVVSEVQPNDDEVMDYQWVDWKRC
jgi:isopentenyl-diphosphate delta-isomerase